MANQNEMFGRLFTGAVRAAASFQGLSMEALDEELGDLVKQSRYTIQRYRLGHLPDVAQEIEAFTRFGVEQALLDHQWAKRFLKAARYIGDEEALLESLFGNQQTGSQIASPLSSGTNIPSHTVSQFVMRDQPFAAVLKGLQGRTSIVVLLGSGGVGKSTLALEVGLQCFVPRKDFQPTSPKPQFEGVVWVSDKWRPGVTRLLTVLDEIVYTLGYPGYAQLELPEKLRAVDQLLRFLRVLVIIDNFETIIDDGLIEWLLQLPFPSKALVTTREYRPAFQQGGYLVELGGMQHDEAHKFIRIWEEQYFVRAPLSSALTNRVIEGTGGNPQVIRLVLGLHKKTGQPIQTLLTPNDAMASMLDSLFRASWELLHTEAQSLLMVLTLFVNSADRAVLGAVAGFDQATLSSAIEALVEAALVDREYVPDTNDEQQLRYAMHPLVQQFVLSISEQNAVQQVAGSPIIPLLHDASQRWLAWAVQRAEQIGFVPKNLGALHRVERDVQTLASAINWALEHGYARETIALVNGLEFFYYVRGWWERKLKLHELYLQAAAQLGDLNEEVRALTMHIQMLSRTENPTLATPFMQRLHQLVDTMELDSNVFFHVYHAEGLYQLALNRPIAAAAAWQQILDQAARLAMVDHMVMGAQRWQGVAFERQGQSAAARAMYEASCDMARNNGYMRDVARNQLLLALLDLAQGDITSAALRLQECDQFTEATDVEQQAHFHTAQGRLLRLQGDKAGAQHAFQTAALLFEQMGLLTTAAARRDEVYE